MTRRRPVRVDYYLAVGEAPGRRALPGAAPLGGLRAKVPGHDWSRWSFVNLIERPMPRSGRGSAFPIEEARDRARSLGTTPWFRRHEAVMLVGRRVARAFGLGYADYLTGVRLPWEPTFYVVPHPSGVNRWWNDPANRERFRAWVLSLR